MLDRSIQELELAIRFYSIPSYRRWTDNYGEYEDNMDDISYSTGYKAGMQKALELLKAEKEKEK